MTWIFRGCFMGHPMGCFLDESVLHDAGVQVMGKEEYIVDIIGIILSLW